MPREKPVPKPKPLTKWERFAKEKGISHKKKDKKVWDEERQEWVNRWGRDGKNKEKEDQWIHEVKPGEGGSFGSLWEFPETDPWKRCRPGSCRDSSKGTQGPNGQELGAARRQSGAWHRVSVPRRFLIVLISPDRRRRPCLVGIRCAARRSPDGPQGRAGAVHAR